MAQKMECRGCASYTTAITSALRDGEPCPYCGADLLTGRESEGEAPDPLATLIANYLRLYVLPANYGSPLYGQTHEDVAKNCAPGVAEVVREHIAERA